MMDEQTPRSRQNFHESFSAEEVAPPSPRSTGLVFVVVAVIVALIFRNNDIVMPVAAGIAALLLALSLLAPQLLQPLNIVWFHFGMLLHKVVNPIVMFLMFAIAMVPVGLLMRIGHDPMRFKRPKDASTYWIEPDPAELKQASMKNQF